MRKTTTNTFSEGMIKDLNPLTTPSTALTDAVNATLITYNGNEFVLQNDMGNCKVERARLSPGFIPLGMKEYGGIVYVAAYNPETGEDEIGSFPAPETDFSTTDFEHLMPANFKSTQFVLNTGTAVNETTSVIRKLVEPELLQLNPGDKYVVVFDIKDPEGTGNEILNVSQMDAYISKDVNARKLFKLKFYKISDDNNLTEIEPSDIKVIEDQPNIEDEYVFFKENSKGTIAVGMETETLDLFEANVIDTSKKTIDAKSIAIEAIGFSDSLADFKGVKVDVTSPEVTTFYIEKGNLNRKVSAKVKDLVADSTFSCSITPYSAYSLFPKLRKDFQVELGKYASAGSGTNDIYRYRVDKNFVKVDFDFKFSGDSDTGLHLYVEFYDPWSDYSIVKVIDNPSYFGINSFIMELVDEPATEVFNASTKGGTPTNVLANNPDTTYEKTILNSTNQIRTNAALRKNHFYIVRISGVDVNSSTSPATYTHYDLYKGLYTNDMFNTVYDLQNSITETSPNYVADFTNLDFNLNEIKYGVTTKEISNINAAPIVSNTREELMTDGKYYRITQSVLSTTPGYQSTKLFKTNKKYSLALSLKGTEKIFGTFKQELATPGIPELTNSSSTDGLHPTIVDVNYDNDPLVPTMSLASWELNQLDSTNYQLSTEVSTRRSVYAPVTSKSIVTTIYKEVSMASQLYSTTNGPFATNRNATVQYWKNDMYIRNPVTGALEHRGDGRMDEAQYTFYVNDLVLNTRPGTSAILMTSEEPTWFYDPDAYHSCGNGNVPWKKAMMMIYQKDAGWKGTRTHDFATMQDFWSKLKVASSVVGTAYAYAPSQNIHANSQIATTVTYPEIDVTTTFAPPTPGTKTYLSTIIFKAVNNARIEFNTATVNSYIASRKGDSVIIDGKDTIRDGFIPYITDTKQSIEPVVIPQTVINQSADNSLVAKFAAGDVQSNSDNSLNPGRYPHKRIFTDDPNYQQFIQYLELVGSVDNIEITPQNVRFEFVNLSTNWIGKFASKVSRCDRDTEAIDIAAQIMITK